MEALVLTGNAINAAVPLVALRLRTDVELTTDLQGKAGSTSGGGSSMGDVEHLPMTLNSDFLPKSMGTYAKGDPFLAKLPEIDSDIQKYDH